MADPPGTIRRIDPDAEAARLIRAHAASAGIREGTVMPVTVDGTVRRVRVTSVETLGNGTVRLTCVPEAAGG